MLGALWNAGKSLLGGFSGLLRFGLKPIKYFIDSRFRPKVVPVPGSVLYCDL